MHAVVEKPQEPLDLGRSCGLHHHSLSESPHTRPMRGSLGNRKAIGTGRARYTLLSQISHATLVST